MTARSLTFGSVASAIFAGKTVNRLKKGNDAVRVVNPRDITDSISPAASLDVLEGIQRDELSSFFINEGDLVITARGNIRVAIAKAEHAGSLPGANLVIVRPNRDVPARVLAALLSHPNIQKALLSDFSGSITSGFSIDSLRKIEFHAPSYDVLTILDDIAEQTENHNQSALNLVRLRREMMLSVIMTALSPSKSA